MPYLEIVRLHSLLNVALSKPRKLSLHVALALSSLQTPKGLMIVAYRLPHVDTFSSNRFANTSFQNFLSCPPNRFTHSSSFEPSQGLSRRLGRPKGNNRPRTQRLSYSFRNLHNATPEPPEREDQYLQVPDARDASSQEGLSAQITSFPPEPDDTYLQVLSDHLPIVSMGKASSISRIDRLVQETSGLAIEDPLRHTVHETEGSSRPHIEIAHRVQEVESRTEYRRYDPKDEAAPRASYFSKGFQDAIKSGRNICGRIAQTLQSCELTQDHESQIYGLLRLAPELHNFQSPVTVTIGIVGESGAGTNAFPS